MVNKKNRCGKDLLFSASVVILYLSVTHNSLARYTTPFRAFIIALLNHIQPTCKSYTVEKSVMYGLFEDYIWFISQSYTPQRATMNNIQAHSNLLVHKTTTTKKLTKQRCWRNISILQRSEV